MIAILIALLIFLGLIVVWIALIRDHLRRTSEILELFELRERMSNAKFQSSVQRSIFSMGAHHGK